MRRWLAAATVLAAICVTGTGPAWAETEYVRGSATYTPSAWPNAEGWEVGDGSATQTRQNSEASGGVPSVVKYRWELPAKVPSAGAMGRLTINVQAGSERIAASFQVDSTMVDCTGIKNAAGYGSGCAQGHHVAVGALAEANQSQTMTQEFRLTGQVAKAIVVTGAPKNVVYEYTAITVGAPIGPSCLSARASQLARASAVNEVRVTNVVPGAAVHKADMPEGVWCPITQGMVIKQGDEISLDPDGEVTLAFADNSTVVVRNTTQLKIASFFAEGGVVRTEILLKMGEVAAQVHKSEATKSDFRIKTPTAIAGVRGTRFRVFHDPTSKASIVSTYEGLVEVDPVGKGLKTLMVPAGREVEATPKSISKLAKLGRAGSRGGLNRAAALARVNKTVAGSACAVTTPREKAFAIRPAPGGWKVTVKVKGKVSGASSWLVRGRKVKALNALARAIKSGCR